MLKLLFFISIIGAVASGQTLYRHSLIYTKPGCNDVDLVIIQSQPTTSCSSSNSNRTCGRTDIFGTGFHSRTACGGFDSIPVIDSGSVTELFTDNQCKNLLTRTFYKQNQCANIATTSSRFSCSGDRMTVLSCVGLDCSGTCGGGTISTGGCTALGVTSYRYSCGRSSPASTITASISLLLLLSAAIAAVLI